jgi:hypothetical protein
MISVDHGRLAPSIELRHHQILRAFKDVFFCSLIIKYHLENVRTIVKQKLLYNQSKGVIGRATAVIVPVMLREKGICK